jgi:predicted AAA+ superfamily ATPase
MKFIKREIQNKIEEKFFQGKIIIVYGARQVGKTTLIKEIIKSYDSCLCLNCDEPDIRKSLSNKNSSELKTIIKDYKLIFIDEAQRVDNIGLTLKLILENFPEKQIIATGSSSFELADKIEEPLTGRSYEFQLMPFSMFELKQEYSVIELKRITEERIIFGMYPEIVQKKDEDVLRNIAKNYLYKDVLKYQDIKKPEILENILQALALQIGNEVSYNEMANLIGVDKKTIENYINILEKAFIVFKLKPYSKNLRTELRKLRKIYFYDTGIRNAVINNFNKLDLRNDKEALWENFLISERVKRNLNQNKHINNYFWRTHDKKEIDLIEEGGGNLFAYEFKYSDNKKTSFDKFKQEYKEAETEIVSQNNYLDFILK